MAVSRQKCRQTDGETDRKITQKDRNAVEAPQSRRYQQKIEHK